MRKYTFSVGDLSDAEDPSIAASVEAATLVEAQGILLAVVRERGEKGGVEGVMCLENEAGLQLWVRLPREAILDLDNWECEDDY